MNEDEAVAGDDCRLSSPFLSRAVISGMNEAGADVYNIDMVPSPLLQFYLAMNKKRAGIYVTASHNPPEYNGFKLMDGIQSLMPKEITKIEKMAEGKNFREGNGLIYRRDVIGQYKEFMQTKVDIGRMKIIMDCANGTCGLVAPDVFKTLGCYITELYAEPNGRFPNHFPDPTKAENLVEVKREVVEENANMGIAFDGDGDRVVFINEKGFEVRSDQALMLFARKILEKTKGKIVYTVNCSRAVEEDIKAHGGTPIVNQVGHSFVKKRLADEDAVFGGEMSGHFFFRDDYFGYDDAIYAAMRMAEIIHDSGKRLSELVAELPKYYAGPEERKACPDEKKFLIVDKMRVEFSNHKQITIDGVRIEFEHGWALVRASNTEPALSLRFEADSEQDMNKIRDEVLASLKRMGVQ
jgi:phosphomannomutase/phosphoglucomutase